MSHRTNKYSAIEKIAIVCHQANKAWCELNGDYSQKDWAEAEDWQKESAVKGVQFRIDNPDAGDDAQHNSWMKEKVDAGWVYGEVKDAEAKTHPCIVPFDQLPLFQQAKDALFCSIVDSFIVTIGTELIKEALEEISPEKGSIISGSISDNGADMEIEDMKEDNAKAE